ADGRHEQILGRRLIRLHMAAMEIDDVERDWEAAEQDNVAGPPLMPEPPRVGFRGVRWRWTDLLIGLAPLVTLRLTALWIEPGSLLIDRWGHLVANLFAVGWMVGFPVWVARRRRVSLPRTSLTRLAVEAGLAVPILFGIWVILAVVFSVWTGPLGGPR